MMALDRLPSGNIRARLMVDGQRFTATFSTEREASDWQIVTRAAAVERRASEALTVEQYARRWLGEFIDAARDLDRYRRDVEHHVIPRLGTYRLSAVSPADIAVLLSRLAAEASAGSADSVRATCRALFDDAVADALLARSPVD
jgi:hypothetical protein